MIWGKLPALFVSCDQAHKISKCPALTLSTIHYNLAFNIHLNKQKYFFQVSYMSRTSARSNAVPYLHCPALTLSRTDVVPHWHLQISFNFKDNIYLGVIYMLLIVGKLYQLSFQPFSTFWIGTQAFKMSRTNKIFKMLSLVQFGYFSYWE